MEWRRRPEHRARPAGLRTVPRQETLSLPRQRGPAAQGVAGTVGRALPQVRLRRCRPGGKDG